MRKATVAALMIAGFVFLATPVFAATGDVIPHGGYSMTTDACLQCHDIHEAAGDYVLMRESTVTDVCATCHTLYQSAPTGAFDPGFPGTPATAVPALGAYRVPIAQAATHPGHRLGMDSNVIPGGTQALNAIRYLGSPATVPATTFQATRGLYCASCHTPHGNFGNMVPASVSTKLLSSRPNRSAEVTGMTNWINDGARWCAACHDRRASSAANRAAGIYNHPDFSCLTCHGDSLVPTPTADFPHTSAHAAMLTLTPDGLCLQCHTTGTLP